MLSRPVAFPRILEENWLRGPEFWGKLVAATASAGGSQRENSQGWGWGAGWRLRAEADLLAVPGVQPALGSESGPRHAEGRGLSWPP